MSIPSDGTPTNSDAPNSGGESVRVEIEVLTGDDKLIAQLVRDREHARKELTKTAAQRDKALGHLKRQAALEKPRREMLRGELETWKMDARGAAASHLRVYNELQAAKVEVRTTKTELDATAARVGELSKELAAMTAGRDDVLKALTALRADREEDRKIVAETREGLLKATAKRNEAMDERDRLRRDLELARRTEDRLVWERNDARTELAIAQQRIECLVEATPTTPEAANAVAEQRLKEAREPIPENEEIHAAYADRGTRIRDLEKQRDKARNELRAMTVARDELLNRLGQTMVAREDDRRELRGMTQERDDALKARDAVLADNDWRRAELAGCVREQEALRTDLALTRVTRAEERDAAVQRAVNAETSLKLAVEQGAAAVQRAAAAEAEARVSQAKSRVLTEECDAANKARTATLRALHEREAVMGGRPGPDGSTWREAGLSHGIDDLRAKLRAMTADRDEARAALKVAHVQADNEGFLWLHLDGTRYKAMVNLTNDLRPGGFLKEAIAEVTKILKARTAAKKVQELAPSIGKALESLREWGERMSGEADERAAARSLVAAAEKVAGGVDPAQPGADRTVHILHSPTGRIIQQDALSALGLCNTDYRGIEERLIANWRKTFPHVFVMIGDGRAQRLRAHPKCTRTGCGGLIEASGLCEICDAQGGPAR